MIDNGYCDDVTNNGGCDFDSGDCCGANFWHLGQQYPLIPPALLHISEYEFTKGFPYLRCRFFISEYTLGTKMHLLVVCG